jgi:hypothetical protein
MSVPGIVLGIVISTLIGAAFHVWRGGSLGRMFLYIGLSWLGFWVGQVAASALDWKFGTIGSVHLGMAIAGAIIFVGAGYWLSLVQVEK